MKIISIMLLVITFYPSIIAAQIEGVEYQWTEKKNKLGIRIETSPVRDSAFKAVRGEMTVKVSVKDLVALIEDTAACPEWAALCKEARLEKRISPTESFVYIYNDIPFPVADRDVYTHVIWTRDPSTKRVTMTSTATNGGTANTKAVRLENAIAQWHFTPQDDGTTLVENFAHIDPNGPTPAWITNLMLVDSPYKSMNSMRKITESGKYAETEVTFLESL